MWCFATIFFHHRKLKAVLHEKCPLRASPIFRDIPSDIMLLPGIAHTWNSMEDTPVFTGIPPHIILMSGIEGLKCEIEYLKGTIINQLQDDMDRRGFYSTERNTKTIIDTMTSQTKQIMEEIVRKTEALTSKITETPGTNGSNFMEIEIEEEEEEEDNECSGECFDYEVLDLRRKIKREVSLEQTKKRKFTVRSHHGKLNVLPFTYQFHPITLSQIIVNWLLGSVSYNISPIWTLSSKKVKHINNGMRMCNLMKCFMSEVKRVTIKKFCLKSKMKDWDYICAINVWDYVQNDFNIKYMANNKGKYPNGKQFTIAFHIQISCRIQRMHSQIYI